MGDAPVPLTGCVPCAAPVISSGAAAGAHASAIISSAVHHLPCRVGVTGPAKVSTYFLVNTPADTSSASAEGAFHAAGIA